MLLKNIMLRGPGRYYITPFLHSNAFLGCRYENIFLTTLCRRIDI
jgi:hypothetical protein